MTGESVTSEAITFHVITSPPTVTIDQPATPSNDTTPSFGGEASEETEVVVHVFEGVTEVGKQGVTASGGKWAITLSKALASGKRSFTAYATEKSGLGNPDGKSSTVAFEVDTEAPVVTIVAPKSPSKNTTLSFSGTASEETEVVLHVFEGATEVGKQGVAASGGKWAI